MKSEDRGHQGKGGGPVYFFSAKAGPVSGSLPGRRLALFLDFDGTLVPIQKDPAKCVLSRQMKEQLRSLADSDRHLVTILSGRTLSDIKARVGIRNICYGGNHGLAISGKDMRFIHSGASAIIPIINKLGRSLEKEIACFDGAWVERKKFSLSLHYRSVGNREIPGLKRTFFRVVKGFPYNEKLTIVKGKKVLELMPDISWDKGRAALWILNKLRGRYLPIFVGDDITDEAAFRALKNSGVTIRIGKSKRTLASYYLKGHREASRFLNSMQDYFPNEVRT